MFRFQVKAKLIVYVTESQALYAFKNGEEYFQKLASASEVEILEDKNNLPENAVSAVTTGAELFIPLLDLVDKDKELARLEKEKGKLISEIERVDRKLKNEKFVSKAPETVVEGERAKGEKYKEMLESVLERINSLK